MKLTRPIVLGAVLAIAVLGAATAVIVANAGSTKKVTTINATEKEFHINLSSHKAAAGQVRFVVKNTGNYIHAFAVSGAGMKQKRTIVEPGKTATLLVNVSSGRYVVWCTMPGHAGRGMRTSFTLPGTTADTADTATTTTSPGTTTSKPIPGY